MKSLTNFKGRSSGFDQERYAHNIRSNVAAASPYTGDVGLELELEGVGLPTRYRGASVSGSSWAWHEDGSLRGPNGERGGGAEYVLNQPCARTDVAELVNNLFADLTKQGASIINSTRCSTHVHLNMQGVKVNQLAAFVALWGTFEDVLSNWCGGHRSGNHFALRLSDSGVALDNWINAFKTGQFRFSREQRYLALNPACLNTFGSLEVRTMKGADRADDVVVWVEALLRLRDLATSDAYSNPQNLAGIFSGYSPVGFMNEVFKGLDILPELIPATAALDESVDTLIVDGFRRIQPILYAAPWSAMLDELAKPYVPNPFGADKKTKSLADVADAMMADRPRIRPRANVIPPMPARYIYDEARGPILNPERDIWEALYRGVAR